MNMLILATAPASIAVKRLTYEANKRKHTVRVVNPMDLFLLVSNSEAGYDRIYQVQKGSVQRLNIKETDTIIVRVGDQVNYAAFALEHMHKNMKIFSTNPAEGIRTASNQLKTLQLLSSNGILTPRTVYASNPVHISDMIERLGGFPIVCKLSHGSGGSGVSLLPDRKTATPILQSLFKSRSSFILQEYLKSGGEDYRVIVIGDQAVACMKRFAVRGDFRANLKQQGKGEAYQLREEEKELAVRACKAAELYTAGVDMIKSGGRFYVIEVNANWGWESEKITGVNYSELLIQFCEQNYQKYIPTKQKVVNYEKLISDERKRYDELLTKVFSSNQRYRQLVADPYIKQIYKKSKDHNVSYRNRENKKCEIRVETIEDLFQIMKDSFVIK